MVEAPMLAKLPFQLSGSRVAMLTSTPNTSRTALRNWVRVRRRNIPGAGWKAGGLVTTGRMPPLPPVPLDVLPAAPVTVVPPAPVVPAAPGEPAELDPAAPAGGPPVGLPGTPTVPVHAAANASAQLATTLRVPTSSTNGFLIVFSEKSAGGRRPLRCRLKLSRGRLN